MAPWSVTPFAGHTVSSQEHPVRTEKQGSTSDQTGDLLWEEVTLYNRIHMECHSEKQVAPTWVQNEEVEGTAAPWDTRSHTLVHTTPFPSLPSEPLFIYLLIYWFFIWSLAVGLRTAYSTEELSHLHPECWDHKSSWLLVPFVSVFRQASYWLSYIPRPCVCFSIILSVVLAMTSYAYNLSTRKAETEGSVAQGQFELLCKFEASLGFMRSCLNKTKTKILLFRRPRIWEGPSVLLTKGPMECVRTGPGLKGMLVFLPKLCEHPVICSIWLCTVH